MVEPRFPPRQKCSRIALLAATIFAITSSPYLRKAVGRRHRGRSEPSVDVAGHKLRQKAHRDGISVR
eukprot:12724866-Prorocentrum_lima.AAC.1